VVDKSKINFIINALMFLCLMAMAGLGLLMKYVLVPGRMALVKYCRPQWSRQVLLNLIS
jgi:hypothetical protein